MSEITPLQTHSISPHKLSSEATPQRANSTSLHKTSSELSVHPARTESDSKIATLTDNGDIHLNPTNKSLTPSYQSACDQSVQSTEKDAKKVIRQVSPCVIPQQKSTALQKQTPGKKKIYL